MLTTSTYEAWAPNYDEWNTIASYTVTGVEHLVASSILRELAPGRVLDVACGTGRWAKYLVTLGWEVHLSDASDAMISEVGRLTQSSNCPTPTLALVEALPYRSETFDLLVCSFAMLHIEDMLRAMTEVSRVTIEGGVVMVSDIHPELQAKWGKSKEISILGKFYPFPCFHYSIEKYTTHARRAGLSLVALYQLKALIDEDCEKAVVLMFFKKRQRNHFSGSSSAKEKKWQTWELVTESGKMSPLNSSRKNCKT